MYSTKTGCVKARFGRFWSRERVRNVHLCARHCHLGHELGTLTRHTAQNFQGEPITLMKKIIVALMLYRSLTRNQKSFQGISLYIIPPQVSPTRRGKVPEAPSFWGMLRREWRDKTCYALQNYKLNIYVTSLCRRTKLAPQNNALY